MATPTMKIMATAKAKSMVITHMDPEGPSKMEEVDDLLKYTSKMQFLGFSPMPAHGATLLVRYASYAQDGGFLNGFGSFGK
jgi:hypothetical protein